MSDELSIEKFREQLKSGQVQVMETSYDYLKGFYEGVMAVLNAKKA